MQEIHWRELLICSVGIDKTVKFTRILLFVLLTLCGCTTTRRSEVADNLGATIDSRAVDFGPYTVHYGSDGDSDLLLVARGHHNRFSVMGSNLWTVVYSLEGWPLLDASDESGDGVFDKVSVFFDDPRGESTVSYVDDDSDGEWDHKVELKAGVLYDWIDGRWVDRNEREMPTNSRSVPAPPRNAEE